MIPVHNFTLFHHFLNLFNAFGIYHLFLFWSLCTTITTRGDIYCWLDCLNLHFWLEDTWWLRFIILARPVLDSLRSSTVSLLYLLGHLGSHDPLHLLLHFPVKFEFIFGSLRSSFPSLLTCFFSIILHLVPSLICFEVSSNMATHQGS